MPTAIRRFLTMLLAVATALVALLMFILGIGRADWGERCQIDEDCKPRLVCGVPMDTPYCTQPCVPGGEETCAPGFECRKWSDAGVCRKR